MEQADVIVVGGGIVGLATAWRVLERWPHFRVRVLEKEVETGEHQTGHNSGVLHSGIYYRPGSLRAQNCRTGKLAMEQFCREHGVAFDLCGKVIVAVNEAERPQLAAIYERGQANGVRCELIGPERLKELEPHAAGVAAIHVPEAGIVNYRQVCRKLGELISRGGGDIRCGVRVLGVTPSDGGQVVATTAGEFSCDYLIACAGLHSDRVARAAGLKPAARVVPFRGEYFELKREAWGLCRSLIYPVPDPNFPFLGVHFTRMIEGGVECGPNAVLAFAREGYRKTDVNAWDLLETLTFGGFLRLAAKYWRVGAGEMWRSFSKAAFVAALARLIPEIRAEMLVPHRAGVRAQAISPEGAMIDDFVIHAEGRMVHVLNAPSPAATSSLNIGLLIADKLAGIISQRE